MKIIHYILLFISWVTLVSFGIYIGIDIGINRNVPSDPLVFCKEYEPCPINFQVVKKERNNCMKSIADLEKHYKPVFDELQLYRTKEKLEADVRAKQIELKLKDL